MKSLYVLYTNEGISSISKNASQAAEKIRSEIGLNNVTSDVANDDITEFIDGSDITMFKYQMEEFKFEPDSKDFDKEFFEIYNENADEIPDIIIKNNMTSRAPSQGVYYMACRNDEFIIRTGNEETLIEELIENIDSGSDFHYEDMSNDEIVEFIDSTNIRIYKLEIKELRYDPHANDFDEEFHQIYKEDMVI